VKKHNKHAKIAKPSGGKFHKEEWAILGAPCSVINSLAQAINSALKLNLAYIDEDHSPSEEHLPFQGLYRNRISHIQYSSKYKTNEYNWRAILRAYDGALINGNHYVAQKQIVIIHKDKKESLLKKLDRLTDVRMILLADSEKEVWDFVQTHCGDAVPIFELKESNKIAELLKNEITASKAPLSGLVFAGGKSSRMGEDKSLIDYHGMSMLKYSASLLEKHVDKVIISTATGINSDSQMPDLFSGLGPYGALLTWFRNNPNSAVITLPCDTPLVDQELIEELISARDSSKMATCFHNPETNFPEPLITIWEPRAYSYLLEFLALGYSCPRKVLINGPIKEIHTKNSEKLVNANTPEERKIISERLNQT
jgi:molybdopterin-guanine dinucleotide biosynthesis protein A